MRKIGKFDFPENSDEAKAWLPYQTRRALARRVVALAKTRKYGKWNAYIDAVPGQNHDEEWHAVMNHGVKLPEEVALAIFPEFDGIPYAD